MSNHANDPDYLALRTAVERDPRNRVTAGALADWLDEHGDPLAARMWRSGFFPAMLALERGVWTGGGWPCPYHG